MTVRVLFVFVYGEQRKRQPETQSGKEGEAPDLLNHAGHALALHNFDVMVRKGEIEDRGHYAPGRIHGKSSAPY